MVKKYKIKYDRDICIGAATCTTFSKRFKLAGDGKADLVGGKEDNDEEFILEIDESEYQEVLESAQSCPVNAIHIYDLSIDKRII